MAFRTGAHVAALADRLQGASLEASESWTYVLPALDEAETSSLLKEFHIENVSPII